jgi:predicted nucleic acid-binding protein
MARIFVDTNVLFPFSVMDLLLALTEDMIHEVIWTERLLGEWERVIVREQHRSAASASAITAAVREYFAESRVVETAYLHLVDEMPGDDPDDRHHMAAAVAGGARDILTWDRGDFPAGPLSALGLRVVDPDTYVGNFSRRFRAKWSPPSYGWPTRSVGLPGHRRISRMPWPRRASPSSRRI